MKYYHPSSLRAGELCPRYKRSEQKDKSAAERGTRIHKAIETRDFSLLETDEERDVVAACMDYADTRRDGMLKEQYEVALQSGNLEGTLDYVQWLRLEEGPAPIRIMDWKSGRVPVDKAELNLQIQAYIKLLFEIHPMADLIEAHIVAPLCRCCSSSYVFSRENDLPKINLRIMAVIARMEDESCEATPSEEACEWCGNKAHCQKLNAIAIRQGTLLPEPFFVEQTGVLAPEQRARRHILADLLQDWAEQVKRADVKAVIEDGLEIPGYGVRNRQGNAKIMDTVAAIGLLAPLGVTGPSVLNACTMSLSKLSDIYHTEKGGTKKDAQETIEAGLKSVIARGEPVVWLQRDKTKKGE